MERAVWAVANVQQSLEKKQQQQDEINNTFDKLAARQEERRVGLVGQVRVRARGSWTDWRASRPGCRPTWRVHWPGSLLRRQHYATTPTALFYQLYVEQF